jgi:hypothetical protein
MRVLTDMLRRVGSQCTACGGNSTAEMIRSREMMYGLREPFTYERCGTCASLTLTDPPQDIAPYYSGAYYSMREQEAPKAGRLRKARVAAALRMPWATVDRATRLRGLQGTPQFARWLAGLGVRRTDRIGDIGSGAGALLREMHASGFTDLWGFDPFLAGNSDNGIRLRRASVDEIPHGFRVLMANHSLEHVPDPLHVLLRASEALVDGGHLLVRVPVARSFAERTFGADWVQLDPPRHLWVPSERGMRLLAERAGLQIQRVFYDSKALQFYGSEQYRKDVPLRDPRSVAEGSDAVFTPPEVEAFERQAQRLNSNHDGDQAGFVLSR